MLLASRLTGSFLYSNVMLKFVWPRHHQLSSLEEVLIKEMSNNQMVTYTSTSLGSIFSGLNESPGKGVFHVREVNVQRQLSVIEFLKSVDPVLLS